MDTLVPHVAVERHNLYRAKLHFTVPHLQVQGRSVAAQSDHSPHRADRWAHAKIGDRTVRSVTTPRDRSPHRADWWAHTKIGDHTVRLVTTPSDRSPHRAGQWAHWVIGYRKRQIGDMTTPGDRKNNTLNFIFENSELNKTSSNTDFKIKFLVLLGHLNTFLYQKVYCNGTHVQINSLDLWYFSWVCSLAALAYVKLESW